MDITRKDFFLTEKIITRTLNTTKRYGPFLSMIQILKARGGFDTFLNRSLRNRDFQCLYLLALPITCTARTPLRNTATVGYPSHTWKEITWLVSCSTC